MATGKPASEIVFTFLVDVQVAPRAYLRDCSVHKCSWSTESQQQAGIMKNVGFFELAVEFVLPAESKILDSVSPWSRDVVGV